MNDLPETVTFALDCAACSRRSFVTALAAHFGPPHYCPWCRNETYAYRPLDPEDVQVNGRARDYLDLRYKYPVRRAKGNR